MLAANTDFEFRFCHPPTFHTNLDQLSDTFLIEAGEGVGVENFRVLIGR